MQVLQAAAVPVVAAVVTAAAACAGAVLVRGSTAVPAACWACAAALAAAIESAVRLAGGPADPAARASARLVVAALAVCPIISLLGAKRPQHGVWQFIVASLAGIMSLPAASATFVRPGTPPDVHELQRWLMLVTVVVAWMNFIGTRHAAAAVLVSVGQVIFMRMFLPFAGTEGGPGEALDAVAACLVASGAVVAAAQSWLLPAGRSRGPGEASRGGGDALPLAADRAAFLALRETLGAAWTLRIAERFNGEAQARGWPCRLRFDGLHVDRGPPAGRGWEAEAGRTLRALLRRFVSPAWMRRHAGEGGNG